MFALSQEARRKSLDAAGLLHPRPDAVQAPLFQSGHPFFLAADKAQVKYEMLRAHLLDGLPVIRAAEQHGYSRPAFYVVATAFEDRGLLGLLDERRGRRGPVKLTPEIAEFLRASPAELSGAQLAREIESRFGVTFHRRTVERLRRR